jgi:cell division protein FtsL
MKNKRFFALFVATNIAMVFLVIYKHSLFNKLSYRNQQLEKEYRDLISKKESLHQEFYRLQSPALIKKFAIENGMQDLVLKQIVAHAPIPSNEVTHE